MIYSGQLSSDVKLTLSVAAASCHSSTHVFESQNINNIINSVPRRYRLLPWILDYFSIQQEFCLMYKGMILLF